MVINQGDIYWIELEEPKGSEPGYSHPHVVIQNNVFNMPVYFPSGSPVLFLYVGLYLKNSSTGGAAGERRT